MRKAKTIVAFTGVIILLFSEIMSAGTQTKSTQTASKTVQTKTKTTQTYTKTVSKSTKPVQTAKKPTTTKSRSTQKNPKTESEIKNKYAGAVKIGTIYWAVANLDVNTFRNGDTIPEAKSNKEWVAAGSAEKPAWCYYNNDPKIGAKYGKLYNWYALNDPRGLAPEGWTLASNADWVQLGTALGGQGSSGRKLKSTTGWNEGDNGTNESGFNGFPGGYRVENGLFQNIGSIGTWWSSTESKVTTAIDNYLSLGSALYMSTNAKQRGEYVRCVKK